MDAHTKKIAPFEEGKWNARIMQCSAWNDNAYLTFLGKVEG